MAVAAQGTTAEVEGERPSRIPARPTAANTCDANYGVVLPPNGVLTLRTVVKPIGDDRSEIAFVGVFDGEHKLNVGRVAVLPEGGQEDRRETNPIWLVPRAVHRLVVDIPRDRTLREITTVELAVDTRTRLITAITLYRPSRHEVTDGNVIVLGDLGSGMAFRLTEHSAGPRGTRITLLNESGGWIAIPEARSQAMTIRIQDSKGYKVSCESTLINSL